MTTTTHNSDPILLIGGTGKTGRRVAERLQARGLPVRIASRSSDTPFDWEDPSTWGPALRGTSAAYVTYYPDIALPGAPEKIAALADIAVRAGTRRLVQLSGRGEVEAQRAERELAERGVTAEWTVVRCSWFMQNFNESYFADPLAAGELALPVGDVREPFVDAEDVADVAVAALTEEGHRDRLYELTGPRLLTFADAVAEIGRATGRSVRFTPIPIEAFEAGLAADDTPADVIALLRFLFTEVLDGRNQKLADGVQRALGREPRDFTAFAERSASEGAWSRSTAA